MSSCYHNLNILRKPASTIHNAYLVKLSPEIIEKLKQQARTVVDVEECGSNHHSASQGPQLIVAEKSFGLKLDQNNLIRLKLIPESSSDVEYYESTGEKDCNTSLWLSGLVKGKLFEEKQLSNKVSENMKKRVLEAQKEAHAHDIKVIQPLENKKRNVNQVLAGNKRRASLPPVLKRSSSELDSQLVGRTERNQKNSEKEPVQFSSNTKKNNFVAANGRMNMSRSHISASAREFQANVAYCKERQSYKTERNSTSNHPSSVDKTMISLRIFVIYMLLLGPLSREELEKERRERFLRFESDTSVSMDTVLEEIAVLQDGKWRLREDKMASLVVSDFPLYSEEESKNAEKILQRWKDQRKLCSEEEIHMALEAFQRGELEDIRMSEDGKELGTNDSLEYSQDELLNKYIEKYRLYYSLVCRLSELSRSFEDLKHRFLNSSSTEERQKLRERIKILKDKHSSKWNVGTSLVQHLERQLIYYKNKLRNL